MSFACGSARVTVTYRGCGLSILTSLTDLNQHGLKLSFEVLIILCNMTQLCTILGINL